jgi:N-acetylneuraminate synthase
MPTMNISGTFVGKDCPCYIIAELSANHNQKYEKAVELIRAAKEAGADAIKIQTYTADTLTIDCDRAEFAIGKGTIWEGKKLYDLYGEAYTPWDWQPKLKRVANDLGMALFSTPFDETSVDFLEEMEVPAYKIASFELVHLPLIRKVAQTHKPLIMSTGMASIEEIEEAVTAAREAGATEIALLKCTSAYPASPEDANLSTILDLAERFTVVTGLSDHTLGIGVPVAAVSLGASIVEKHFTLSRDEPGPDSAFSLEPQEFKEMVDAIRIAEKAIGQVSYGLTKNQEASIVFRRSLFVVQDMKKGDEFTAENVRVIRPGNGLLPKHLEELLGKKAACAIDRGTPLKWELVE